MRVSRLPGRETGGGVGFGRIGDHDFIVRPVGIIICKAPDPLIAKRPRGTGHSLPPKGKRISGVDDRGTCPA